LATKTKETIMQTELLTLTVVAVLSSIALIALKKAQRAAKLAQVKAQSSGRPRPE
jgi:hypothetical protein